MICVAACEYLYIGSASINSNISMDSSKQTMNEETENKDVELDEETVEEVTFLYESFDLQNFDFLYYFHHFHLWKECGLDPLYSDMK